MLAHERCTRVVEPLEIQRLALLIGDESLHESLQAVRDVRAPALLRRAEAEERATALEVASAVQTASAQDRPSENGQGCAAGADSGAPSGAGESSADSDAAMAARLQAQFQAEDAAARGGSSGHDAAASATAAGASSAPGPASGAGAFPGTGGLDRPAAPAREASTAEPMQRPDMAVLQAASKDDLVALVLRTHDQADEAIRQRREQRDNITRQMYACLARERMRSQALAQTLQDERESHAAHTGALLHQCGVALRAVKASCPALRDAIGPLGENASATAAEQANEIAALKGTGQHESEQSEAAMPASSGSSVAAAAAGTRKPVAPVAVPGFGPLVAGSGEGSAVLAAGDTPGACAPPPAYAAIASPGFGSGPGVVPVSGGIAGGYGAAAGMPAAGSISSASAPVFAAVSGHSVTAAAPAAAGIGASSSQVPGSTLDDVVDVGARSLASMSLRVSR